MSLVGKQIASVVRIKYLSKQVGLKPNYVCYRSDQIHYDISQSENDNHR